MKKIILTIAILGVQIISTYALTQVSGGIYRNATWTLSNSPYLVSGSIVVFPGATLNIEPGVEVRIEDDPALAPGIYIEARGTINMLGTPALPITFRADSAIQTVGAWQGFKVNNAQGGVINYDYVSVSNANATFNYSGTPPQDVVLHGCTFNYNYYAVQSALNMTLDSCFFYGNNSAVAGWSIFNIKRCIFDSNGAALPVYASSLIVDSCIFTKNAVAINLSTIPFTGMTITNSFFGGNSFAINNPGNGSIRFCEFVDNTNGIASAINADISDCFFSNNYKAVQLGFGSKISKCNINNNAFGVGFGPIGFGQPAPVVENNKICSNDSFNIENNTDLNLFVASNCFCESDSSIIESKILDGYDDISRGLISYAIYDTGCVNVLQSVNKANPNTGLKSIQTSEFKIYPNPTNGQLFLGPLNTNVLAQIFDQSGKALGAYNLNTGMNSLDLAYLPGGLYVLRLTNESQTITYKLILN